MVFLDVIYNPHFPVEISKITVLLLNRNDFNRSLEIPFPSPVPNSVGDEVLWGF